MNDLTKFHNPVAKPETFDQIQIGLASPLYFIRLYLPHRHS